MILDNLYKIRPKISIILPSFNREHFISEAIESCLNQTFLDFELIIIDDNSTDNSVAIIKKYLDSDTRIKFFQNDINQKLPCTLNIGFKYASGEYFTWISDDNLFHPTALELMNKILDTMPEIGLVYADYTTINKKGEIINRLYQEQPEYLPIRDCVGACFLYRSILVSQVGEYDKNFYLVEDYEYWLRISLVTKLYHINESLYFYRIHDQSLTKTRKKEISIAQNLLKEKFRDKFILDDNLKPINDLYMCFISKKSFLVFIKFLLVIMTNPIITLSYIIKHVKRIYRQSS